MPFYARVSYKQRRSKTRTPTRYRRIITPRSGLGTVSVRLVFWKAEIQARTSVPLSGTCRSRRERPVRVLHGGFHTTRRTGRARAMQLRWLTSDRTWRFWWLRSRANPKPRKCDMASAWGERHRRRAPDFTSQSAGFRTQTTCECRRRRAFSTPLPKRTTTNGAAAGRLARPSWGRRRRARSGARRAPGGGV